jgi:DNA helicase-2/ATP-dependent DNA helicase PcrA
LRISSKSEMSIPPNIVVLTFSRAATRELRERLDELLGVEQGEGPSVSTLHSFALRQLLRNRGAPNLPRPIRVADDYDERWVIVEELRRLTGADRVRDIRKELRDLASDWETLAAEVDEWERQHPNPRFLGAWRRHREIYGYTLRAELVYAVKKALEQDPNFELERHFEHVLVDEYQDLNKCELEVVRSLVERGPSLYVAGDDDQRASTHSETLFRLAYVNSMRRTKNHSLELEVCHRCDRDILQVALSVVEQDVNRIPKVIRPRDDAGDGDVQSFAFNNITHEANGIRAICQALLREGVDPAAILILLRNDPQGVYSTPIVDALTAAGIRVEMPVDPLMIFSTKEGRPVVCLLRLMRDRGDGLAWRELMELRANGVGVGTLRDVYELADEQGVTFAEALELVRVDPDAIGGSRRKSLAADLEIVNEILDELAGVVDDPVEDSLDFLLGHGLPETDRDDAREVLLDLVADQEATLADIEQALQALQGMYEREREETEEGGVLIMTMHSAKGLTADAVIVPACEDELIPGAAEERRALDDERRLLYVSLTRAKHYMVVTYAGERRGRQSTILSAPIDRTLSRFLRDFINPQRP